MRTILIISLTAALALSACGEREFDAQEFIAAANDEGAGLTLGTPLSTNDPSREVYAVELGAQTVSGEPVSGGGSIVVTESTEAGEAEHARCEGAVSLVCYRAANVVLELDGELTPRSQERLDEAFRGLAGGS